MEGLKELVNAGFTVHLSGQAFLGINAPEPRMSRFEMKKKRTGKVEAKKRRRANGFKSRASRIFHENIRKQKKAQEQLKDDSIHVASSPYQLGTSFVATTAPVAPQNELFETGESTLTHCNQKLEVSRDFSDTNLDNPPESISHINSGPPENMDVSSPLDDDNLPAQGGSTELFSEELSSGIPHVDDIQDIPALPEIHKAQILSNAALYHKLLAQCSSGLDPISLLDRRKKIT
ncbi:hypothetical protein METSCH_F02560 [Metschnikowia aff. pulcherrima]|uniref:Uncharacterized protein n=1 Tax=Metschnikowia aff. pulcherrima TaxID=2163413 RepID=A0A4P6XSW5_9ASCO|nr:hypothetical protein METSCH_F02560 [Metschnikowia aff. pulcherrima]